MSELLGSFDIFFLLGEYETLQDREIILWILNTLEKNEMRQNPIQVKSFSEAVVPLKLAVEIIMVLACWNI